MSDNRPPRYEEDGRIVYRASGLGMCDKMFVALSMGYDARAHPAWFQEILDEGTANESVIRGMWEQELAEQDGPYPTHNIAVTDIGKVTEMEVLDGIWVRGSIDGLLNQEPGNVTLQEFKKIRDSGWMRYLQSGVEFQANYPMQTAFYMHSLAEEFGFEVSMDFVGGHYVQDEKTQEWSITEVHRHLYTTPPVPLIGIKKRIAKLERLIADTDAIGDMTCNIAMYPCPVYYLHDDDMDEPPVRPSDDIVRELVTQYDALEQERAVLKPKVEKIEKAQKGLKEGVQAWLVASGQDSGDVSTLELGEGTEAAVKYLVSPRKGYEVPPGEQTRVTIKVTKREGTTVAKAPRKSRAKVTKETTVTESVTVETDEAPAPPATPAARTLAPRPGR